MTQLNIHMTPELEKDLNKFMKIHHLSTKASAIRLALKEGIKYSLRHRAKTDFSAWLGLATKAPLKTKPRFSSDDDLWK